MTNATEVQEQFAATSVELKTTVRGDMSPDLRDRHLVHTISDLVGRLVRVPGTNPRGLVVTVTTDPATVENPAPDYNVLASAPLYS